VKEYNLLLLFKIVGLIVRRDVRLLRIDSNILKTLSLITQLGIIIVVSTFLGLFIGKALDGLLSTNFFAIVFLILGIMAAFKNAYTLLMKQIKEKDENDQ
jgi:ATP synthase protein I